MEGPSSKVPVERKMRGDDAAAGHRGDVRDLAQETCIAQKTDESEMIQGRAKSSAGQSEPDFLHRRLSDKVRYYRIARRATCGIIVAFAGISQAWDVTDCRYDSISEIKASG
jgi:hypothetical protein